MKLAQEIYRKKKTEIREGRFFPEAPPAVVWNPSFAEHIDDFLLRTRSTVVNVDGAKRYGMYWKEAPETKGKTMRQLARADAEAYRERRRKEGAPGARRTRGGGSESTVNKELSWARGVFNDWLAQLEEKLERGELKAAHNPIPRNPFSSSRRGARRLYYSVPRAPKQRHLGSHGDDEAERLFAALPDIAATRKVALGILTGVDRGPMFAWTWDEDINFRTRKVRSWRRKGQGELREYWVPMTDEVEQILRAIEAEQIARWGAPSRWVFPNAANTGHEDGAEFVRTVFQPALLRAGINRETVRRETKRVRAGLRHGKKLVQGFRTVEKITRKIERTFRWKDLRHTFATWMLLKGVQLPVVAEALGHAPNSPCTLVYAHVTPSAVTDAVAQLSGLVTIH